MKIFLPFHIPKLVKSLPFRAEPPRIGHYREYPPGTLDANVNEDDVFVGFCIRPSDSLKSAIKVSLSLLAL